MKGLILEYSLNGKPDKETIKMCDEARGAMQTLLVETARVTQPKLVPIMWLLTRFYKKEVTDTYIRYTFPLVRSE